MQKAVGNINVVSVHVTAVAYETSPKLGSGAGNKQANKHTNKQKHTQTNKKSNEQIIKLTYESTKK